MYQEFFSRSPLLALPILALAIFVGIFAVEVVRAIRRKPEEIRFLQALPLEDDTFSARRP